MMATYRYKKFPYRVEFPDSSEDGRSCQTLEDALWWARFNLHRVWSEDGEWGRQGEPTTDAETAVITNRNTGYRWILRRTGYEVEFQTPEMLEDLIAEERVELFLSVEEVEALARVAKASDIEDRRTKALADQALDQIAAICRRVRERVRVGDKFIDRWTGSIPRRTPPEPEVGEQPESEEQTQRIKSPESRYRPLGDPDNLSLKEAGQLLGKARNTVYLWYRNGKFPPAVDVSPLLGKRNPVIVVPRYRLDAWLAGERMPRIFQDVFDSHGLREPPWGCWSAKKGASAKDIAFWVDRRGLTLGVAKGGRRIYGQDLKEGKIYELSDADA